MELKNDVFIINYSENDKDFAKTLFNQLNENKKRVMDFFELDKEIQDYLKKNKKGRKSGGKRIQKASSRKTNSVS